jgi:hypothetical protein
MSLKSQTFVSPSTIMTQYLPPVIVAVALLIGLTVPQAIWTERFIPRETTAEQQAMAERLKKLPMAFGDWVGKVQKIDDASRRTAKIVGDFSVEFHNKLQPSQVVTIMIACGHGKDMSTHTPDQCFIASGFAISDHEQPYPLDLSNGVAQFTTCRFRKDVAGQGPQSLRIFWSFNEDGKWFLPTWRAQLANMPALYKIYATTYLPSDTKENPSQSPAVGFLKEFLPMIQDTLFPPAGSAGATEESEKTPSTATPDAAPPAEAVPSAK